MSKCLAIVKNKGAEIPGAFLAKVAEKYKSQCGFAVIETDGGVNNLRCEALDEAFDPKDLLKQLESAKDDTVLLAFGDGAVTSVEHLQPYIVLGTPEEPLLVVAMDGEYDVVTPEGVPSSAAILEEEVRPVLEKLYTQSGKDIVKFMDLLRDPVLAKQFNRLANGDAQMIFFSVSGELMNFCKSEKFTSFPWGKVTDALGYSEGSYPAQEATTAKKMGLFGRLKNKAAGTPKNVADGDQKVEPKVDPLPGKTTVPTVTPAKNKPDEPLPADGTSITPEGEWKKEGTKLFYRPVPSITEKNAIKKAYRNHAGGLPQHYQTRDVEGKFLWEEVMTSLQKRGFRTFAGIPKELVTTVERKPDNNKTIKDTSVKNLAESVTPRKDIAGPSIPVLDTSDLKSVEAFLAKGTVKQALDNNAQAIADPQKLRSQMESKAPDLATQLGLDGLHSFYNLPFNDLVELATKHPKAAAILNHNLIVKILDMNGTKQLIPTISAPADKKEVAADTGTTVKKKMSFGRQSAA